MTTPLDPICSWTEKTIDRLNARFGVQHDDDVGLEDWPVAMADPSLLGAALEAYDSPEAGADTRAVVVELLLNMFEYGGIERDGNPDWRRTVDRIERDFAQHRAAVQRWAAPEEDWLIRGDMLTLLARNAAS
jgi:hypothetical protein